MFGMIKSKFKFPKHHLVLHKLHEFCNKYVLDFVQGAVDDKVVEGNLKPSMFLLEKLRRTSLILLIILITFMKCNEHIHVFNRLNDLSMFFAMHYIHFYIWLQDKTIFMNFVIVMKFRFTYFSINFLYFFIKIIINYT